MHFLSYCRYNYWICNCNHSSRCVYSIIFYAVEVEKVMKQINWHVKKLQINLFTELYFSYTSKQNTIGTNSLAWNRHVFEIDRSNENKCLDILIHNFSTFWILLKHMSVQIEYNLSGHVKTRDLNIIMIIPEISSIINLNSENGNISTGTFSVFHFIKYMCNILNICHAIQYIEIWCRDNYIIKMQGSGGGEN